MTFFEPDDNGAQNNFHRNPKADSVMLRRETQTRDETYLKRSKKIHTHGGNF